MFHTGGLIKAPTSFRSGGITDTDLLCVVKVEGTTISPNVSFWIGQGADRINVTGIQFIDPTLSNAKLQTGVNSPRIIPHQSKTILEVLFKSLKNPANTTILTILFRYCNNSL